MTGESFIGTDLWCALEAASDRDYGTAVYRLVDAIQAMEQRIAVLEQQVKS